MRAIDLDGTSAFLGGAGRIAHAGAAPSVALPSVALPSGASRFWRKLAAFTGPGFLVAVGYMDPGNWATDIAGGSAYGYTLLSVVLASSMVAMLLQALSARLGIVTGMDLAQACAARTSRRVCVTLWAMCEVAIVACDLAEVIGSAIALQLLFGVSLPTGVVLSGFSALAILALQRRGFRSLEAFVIVMISVVAGCFGVEMALAHPSMGGIATGFLPHAATIRDPGQLYLAIGILGATVMPHNLYLHSSIVQTRAYDRTRAGKREAVKFATIDSSFALTLAFVVNVSILVLGAAVFHRAGHTDVTGIGQAYHLLDPLLGVGTAGMLFAIALLASGQNSTITGTLAGQIVMEGFLGLTISPTLRRLLTRSLAMIPALAIACACGASGANRLLVFSQVVLSLQLPFAVVPLILFTSDRRLMGEFAVAGWLRWAAIGSAAGITLLNAVLLVWLL